MSKVVQLSDFRGRSRKLFFRKHGSRLDNFIKRFIDTNIDVDFIQIQEDYQELCAKSGTSWDYVRFREVLTEALDEVFGKMLYSQLQQERWFDARLITKDEVIERCLSVYVMSATAAVFIGR